MCDAAPAEAPLLLALETATSAVSLALLRGDALVAERVAPDGQPSETLLPALDGLLREAGEEVAAVEHFAVSVGPGSFTSLRIGIATVKGLAFGRGAVVAPVPTLAALARAAGPSDEPVVALLDARRGEVYASAWRAGGEEPHPSVPEGIYTPQSLATRLPSGCLLVGEGVSIARAELEGREGVRIASPERGLPRAAHVGALGALRLARGDGVAAADLVPSYGRRAEAEVRRDGVRFDAGPGDA